MKAASLPPAEVNVTSSSLCSCCGGSGQTQELTADLWSVAAVSIDAVPGSEAFTSVAAVGHSPPLCVCVWLFVCLFVCSVSQPPVTRSDFTWRWTSPLAGPTHAHASSFSSLRKVTYFFNWYQNSFPVKYWRNLFLQTLKFHLKVWKRTSVFLNRHTGDPCTARYTTAVSLVPARMCL